MSTFFISSEIKNTSWNSKVNENNVCEFLSGTNLVEDISKNSVISFKTYDFEWLILFSAFTDVDEAEKQRGDKNGACWNINVKGVKNIIDACQEKQRKLISTAKNTKIISRTFPHMLKQLNITSSRESIWTLAAAQGTF